MSGIFSLSPDSLNLSLIISIHSCYYMELFVILLSASRYGDLQQSPILMNLNKYKKYVLILLVFLFFILKETCQNIRFLPAADLRGDVLLDGLVDWFVYKKKLASFRTNIKYLLTLIRYMLSNRISSPAKLSCLPCKS